MTIKEANDKLMAETKETFKITLDVWNHRHDSPPTVEWSVFSFESSAGDNYTGATLEQAVENCLKATTPKANALREVQKSVDELPAPEPSPAPAQAMEEQM